MSKNKVIEDTKDLFIEDETFADARANINVMLQRTFRNMIDSDSDEGSITLKIDIKMTKETVEDHSAGSDGRPREVVLPQFSHKVSSAVQLKDEIKGASNPQMEIVWDDEQKKFVLKYVSNTTQRSIFDDDMNQPQENVKALPGPSNALPDKQADGDVIDAEVIDDEDDDYEYDEPDEGE